MMTKAIAVMTCAVYPSEAEAFKKLWIFRESVDKFKIPDVHYYGIGESWTIYINIKLNKQLAYLKTLASRYTHVLYTDGQDAFFTAGLDEILAKYRKLGSPAILTSAYSGFADSSAPPGFGDESVRLRYPHVGGHLSEIPAIIEAFERMLTLPNQTSDDSFSWRDAWLEGWFRPKLDSKCDIFQVTDENCVVSDEPHQSRLRNIETASYPCLLHLAGGYTSQIDGKDDRLIPWAKRLSVI